MHIPRALKYAIIIIVLAVAFIMSFLLGVIVSVNLAVPIQNSNRTLDGWVKTLQGRSISLYYAEYNFARYTLKAETITQFETMLSDHEATEAYWHWTELAFPFQIVFGKIWFTDVDTTYYLQTTW